MINQKNDNCKLITKKISKVNKIITRSNKNNKYSEIKEIANSNHYNQLDTKIMLKIQNLEFNYNKGKFLG